MKLIQQHEDDIHYILQNADTDVWEIVEKICADDTSPSEVPIYICNVDDIVLKHKNWLAKLPRVIPHYAVKCNDSNIVLATLAALGTSFDCASKAEIAKVLALGVAPERIIFAQPAKPASHLRYAAQFNVKQMTVDSEIELHKIKRLYPEAKCVIRIRCDATEAQCPLGKKFGCDPFSEAPKLIKLARSLNLDVIGISFHVGSGCSDYPIFATAIRICKDLFEYAENIGYNFSLLDIGGGFHGDKGKTIDEVTTIINQALETYFPVESGVKIVAEPGRYYVSSAYTLLTNIHSKKEVILPITGESHMMYYINDGVYGSFNSMLYDHQICVPKLLKQQADKAVAKTYQSTIFGPSCDALDTINENIQLPDMEIGDFIVWENMGAYTMVCASPFNGFPIPKTHIYVGRETWEMLKSLLPSDNEYLSLIAANMHQTDNIVFA